MKVVLVNVLLLLAILNFVTSDTVTSDVDCETHVTCTECVSESACHWCLGAHSCTRNTNENCPNDISVTGDDKRGPTFCPAIVAKNNVTEILVPSGDKRALHVRVHINSHAIIQSRFVCQYVNVDGRVTSVNAHLLGDSIYCDPNEFSYASNSPYLTVPFAVVWGKDKPLDNPDNVQVVVYKCKEMAVNCGACLALPEKYNCGWCQSTSACEVANQCSNGGWLNRSLMCPVSV